MFRSVGSSDDRFFQSWVNLESTGAYDIRVLLRLPVDNPRFSNVSNCDALVAVVDAQFKYYPSTVDYPSEVSLYVYKVHNRFYWTQEAVDYFLSDEFLEQVRVACLEYADNLPIFTANKEMKNY